MYRRLLWTLVSFSSQTLNSVFLKILDVKICQFPNSRHIIVACIISPTIILSHHHSYLNCLSSQSVTCFNCQSCTCISITALLHVSTTTAACHQSCHNCLNPQLSELTQMFKLYVGLYQHSNFTNESLYYVTDHKDIIIFPI